MPRLRPFLPSRLRPLVGVAVLDIVDGHDCDPAARGILGAAGEPPSMKYLLALSFSNRSAGRAGTGLCASTANRAMDAVALRHELLVRSALQNVLNEDSLLSLVARVVCVVATLATCGAL